MYTNRFLRLLIAISLLAVVVLVVREANATVSLVANVDTATRSYTAWAEAAEAEASTVDSATRSYREAFATSLLRAEGNAVTTCASLPSRDSIHSKYVKQAKMRILYTEDGPAGVDGGLKELATAYRTCSR